MKIKGPSILQVEMEKLRRAILDSPALVRPGRHPAPMHKAPHHPMFPLTFLLRNVMILETEAHWQGMPPHQKRAALLSIVAERCGAFSEVHEWLDLHGKLPAINVDPPDAFHVLPYDTGHCTHCGGCCEIASGLADFPAGTEIPPAWKRLFADGLGANHRFCAFLWEANGQGLSICSIHEWRPNPCRTFAVDECRNLMEDVDFYTLLDPSRLIETCRRLCILLNGR